MSNSHPTIAFIGAGNMTRCLISGLIANHYPSHQIWASNPTIEKLDYLTQQFNIHTATDNLLAAKQAEVVVLAVKPQMMKIVAQEIAPLLQQTRPLVISIAAGITTSTLRETLGNDLAIVRCMPNLPALVNSGATGMFAIDLVTTEQHDLAEMILRSVGITLWVDDEKLMDVIAALSGTGPAYFFLVMEALEHAAHELGLSQENARLLTLQTAFGAAKLALATDEDTADLRKRVTSKGGITEKAIEVLETTNVRETFAKALRAAHERSRKMVSS